jgi:hypothetical protein
VPERTTTRSTCRERRARSVMREGKTPAKASLRVPGVPRMDPSPCKPIHAASPRTALVASASHSHVSPLKQLDPAARVLSLLSYCCPPGVPPAGRGTLDLSCLTQHRRSIQLFVARTCCRCGTANGRKGDGLNSIVLTCSRTTSQLSWSYTRCRIVRGSLMPDRVLLAPGRSALTRLQFRGWRCRGRARCYLSACI